MEVPVTEAKTRLTELVRRAEAGDEVILTRHGHPAARIVAVAPRRPTPQERQAAIEEILDAVKRHPPSPGPDAAHAADFLYDDDGMPA